MGRGQELKLLKLAHGLVGGHYPLPYVHMCRVSITNGQKGTERGTKAQRGQTALPLCTATARVTASLTRGHSFVEMGSQRTAGH